MVRAHLIPLPHTRLGTYPALALGHIFNENDCSYSINSIKADLTPNQDKPLWPFSCYGPAKYEPCVPAFQGQDISFEEMRNKARVDGPETYVRYVLLR